MRPGLVRARSRDRGEAAGHGASVARHHAVQPRRAAPRPGSARGGDQAAPPRARGAREDASGPITPKRRRASTTSPSPTSSNADYEEAEQLYKRSIAIKEAALGATHPEVALTLNNLAELYRSQRRFDEAEPLYNRALAIDQEALGADHPSLALGLNNLALMHYDQGAYVKAEELLGRALAIEEEAFGRDDPALITTLENYAAVLRELRRGDEAEELDARARSLRAQL